MNIVLILIEALAMCFLMLLVCVVGIANGPVGSVYFYEEDVQKRVVDLGLITKKEIKKRSLISVLALFIPVLFFVPLLVYFVNGARDFLDIFIQITSILMIEGIFDRIFIDSYWVGKTKAWIIPGTEDLMPYVPKKTIIRKWIGTIIGFPLIALIQAFIMTRF